MHMVVSIDCSSRLLHYTTGMWILRHATYSRMDFLNPCRSNWFHYGNDCMSSTMNKGSVRVFKLCFSAEMRYLQGALRFQTFRAPWVLGIVFVAGNYVHFKYSYLYLYLYLYFDVMYRPTCSHKNCLTAEGKLLSATVTYWQWHYVSFSECHGTTGNLGSGVINIPCGLNFSRS